MNTNTPAASASASVSDLFVTASRSKLRFSSQRGDLTTEQLWDLPLTSKSGFDLDSVAKAVNAELKTSVEESFVSTASNPTKSRLELQLDVVKFVIAVRMQENALVVQRQQSLAQRQQVVQALERKQFAAIDALTPEELQARLAEIDGTGT